MADFLDKYITLAISLGADDVVVFSPDQIVFDERTILKCMFGCADYGYGHTCPSRPGSLKPWEYKPIFQKYQSGLIVHSTDKKIAQEASYEVERQAFFDGYYFAFSLSDCALCGTCQGFAGKPCQNPRKARPAFHSVGIDVFKTARAFGLPIETLFRPGQQENWYSAVFIE